MTAALRFVIGSCDWIYSAFFVCFVAALLLDAFAPSQSPPPCGTPFMAAVSGMGLLALPAVVLAIGTHRRRRRVPSGQPLRLLLTLKLGLLILALVPALLFSGGA